MMAEAEREFVLAIIILHDEHGWTFREIGELAEMSHSWVFKLYQRGKRERARVQ